MLLPCNAAKADPLPASMILGAMAGRGGGGAAAAAIARKIMFASGVDVKPKRLGIPAHQPLAVLIAAASCGVHRKLKIRRVWKTRRGAQTCKCPRAI